MPNELSCKITRLYNPSAKWVAVLLFVGYAGVCIYYFMNFLGPMHRQVISNLAFTYFFGFGLAAVLIIPFILTFTFSHLILNKDEIIEHRGYFFGLFKIPEIRTPWSEVKSWEADYSTRRNSKSYYFELFLKNKEKLIIGDNDRYWYNNAEIEWKAFEKHLKALVREIGLPIEDYEYIPHKKSSHEKIGSLGLWASLILLILATLGIVGLFIWAIVVVGAKFLNL